MHPTLVPPKTPQHPGTAAGRAKESLPVHHGWLVTLGDPHHGVRGAPLLCPPRVPLPVLPQLSPPSLPGTQACRVSPPSHRELAEALTLAEGTGAAFVPPGSLPRRRRGRSMASPAGRVGPVGESVPVAKPLLPNRPLPERAHRSCRRRGGRGGERRGRPRTPHLPTQPSPPPSCGQVGAGFGICREFGQGARGSRCSRLGSACTLEELARCPR